MSTETKVTRSVGGTNERTVPISQITIPNLWHIAECIRKTGRVADGPACAQLISECWYIAHDLKIHIEGESNP